MRFVSVSLSHEPSEGQGCASTSALERPQRLGPREISRELIRAAKMWASGCTIGGGLEQGRANAADEEPHDLDRRH